jgi:hypothetical protein
MRLEVKSHQKFIAASKTRYYQDKSYHQVFDLCLVDVTTGVLGARNSKVISSTLKNPSIGVKHGVMRASC